MADSICLPLPAQAHDGKTVVAVSVGFTPGSTIRRARSTFCSGRLYWLDTIVGREIGKRRLDHIPISDSLPDRPIRDQRASSATNLISVPEDEWQAAIQQFTILKPLFEMDNVERTRAHVEKVAKIVGKHPATIYRWIDAYNRSKRLSVFPHRQRRHGPSRRLDARQH